MLTKTQIVIALFCSFQYAYASSAVIGTASVRGDLRVDNSVVKGNATLFDGSKVETNSQATADLRLAKGTSIVMATNSRGMLYHDHLVLQQGKSELTASSAYRLDANGLHVTPGVRNSHGLVTVQSSGAVEVAALSGTFGVTDSDGQLLATIRPGQALSFANADVKTAAKAAPNAPTTELTGVVVVKDGSLYMETDGKMIHLNGQNLTKHIGHKVEVRGKLVTNSDGSETLVVTQLKINGSTWVSGNKTLVWAGVATGAAAGTAVGVYETQQTAASTSR